MTVPANIPALMISTRGMKDTGWVTVGTGAEDASYGTKAWGADASNVTADDSSYAVAASGSGNTYYLKGMNLGLSIPAGATIDGIEVRVEAGEGAGASTLERVRIVKADGTIGATERGEGAALDGVETLYTYGGASDLWGESWSSTDTNDADFGFAVSFNQNFAGITAVDYMQVKIHYKA
jgi:hypothetical protein